MAFKIKDLENKLGDVLTTLGCSLGQDLIEEVNKDYQLWCTTCCYHLPELNVNIHQAEIKNYEENENVMCELSDTVYLVFDSENKNFLYSEQGNTLENCILNYCLIVMDNEDYTMDKVKELDCTYLIDKGVLLSEYNHTPYLPPAPPVK